MVENKELDIVGFGVFPMSSVTYLSDITIRLEFKNKTKYPIKIDTIVCSFKTDFSSREAPKISIQKSIPPDGVQPIDIPYYIDLDLKQLTNTPTLTVEYTVKKTKTHKSVYSDVGSVIIYPPHPQDKSFFISYKSPEDEHFATKLKFCLNKLGFEVYIAENFQSPGLDIWKEKIYPEINDCLSLIVLWTSRSEVKPENIIKEIKYAKKQRKKIIPLVEKNMRLPGNIIAESVEYHKVSRKINENELINFVKAIDKIYTSGKLDTEKLSNL